MGRSRLDRRGNRSGAVGGIVTALAGAGLRISHLIECEEELARPKISLATGYPGERISRAVKA